MKNNNLKKNLIYQVSYEILVILLPLVLSPYVSRVIGAEGLGVYDFTNSVAQYFVLFSMLGIKIYGNRMIAQCRDNQSTLNQTFSNLLSLHLLISITMSAAYIIFLLFVEKLRLYFGIMFLYVLSGLFDISWFYFGIEEFKTSVFRNAISKILNVVIIFCFVKSERDTWIYCLSMAGCILLSQVALWIPLKKHVKLIKPQRRIIITYLKPMLILFIPTIAVSLYTYMDKIMIGGMTDTKQVGLYSNAAQLMAVPTAIISAFGTVMLPKMSNLTANGEKKTASNYFDTSIKYFMLISVGMAFGLSAISKVFVPIYWGEAFEQCIQLVKCLSIAVPFMALANVVRTQYLIPKSMDHIYIGSVICGAVVNMIVNLCLIRKYGALGASIGTVCAESSVCIYQLFFTRKTLKITKHFPIIVAYILIGAFMFFSLVVINEYLPVKIWTIIIEVLLGGLIYGVFNIILLYHNNDAIICKYLKRSRK